MTKKSFLLSITALLIVSSSFWLLRQHPIGAPQKILACDKNKIHDVRLQRKGKNEEVLLKRTNLSLKKASSTAQNLLSEWTITKPNLGEANASFVQRIVGSLCSLPELSPLPTQDLKSLGLVDPSITARLTEPGKKDWLFAIGTEYEARKVAIHVSQGGGPGRIYPAPIDLKNIFLAPLKRFQNYKIMKMSLGSLDYIKMTRNKKEKFTLERNGADWRLLKNGTVLRSNKKELRKFANRLGTLRALNVLEKEITEEKCAARTKTIQVELEGIGGKREMIYFSSPQKVPGHKRKIILSCNNKRKALFVVHKDMWKYLNAPLLVQ